MELKGKKVNFLGDSITESWGCSDESKAYHQLIKVKHGLNAARNYGIGGSRLAKQIVPSDPRMDLDFCLRAKDMDKDADIVVVFGGTNDFGHGDAPIGEFSDRTPDTFYGSLHWLYSYLIKEYSDSVIFIMTPLKRSDMKVNDKGLTLDDYVNMIKEVAAYYSLPVIDLYTSSGICPDIDIIKGKYVPDGLHPNDNGHILLAERVANFILSY